MKNQFNYKIQSNETQKETGFDCVNQSAEQVARNVIPRRAKVTKTQIKTVSKSEQKKGERDKRNDKKNITRLLILNSRLKQFSTLSLSTASSYNQK